MQLCVVITPTASLPIPVQLPQGPSIGEVLGGQAWAGTHPPLPDGVLSREKAPQRLRGRGVPGREAGRPEEEKRRRKGWEGERGARGRGNSRLRRANGNGRTRWHQIPFGQWRSRVYRSPLAFPRGLALRRPSRGMSAASSFCGSGP